MKSVHPRDCVVCRGGYTTSDIPLQFCSYCCAEHGEEASQLKMQQRARQFIPERYLHAKPSEAVAELEGYDHRLGEGIYLYGEVGTGKTYQSAILMKKAILANPLGDFAWWSVSELMNTLREDQFSNVKQNRRILFSRLINTDFLVLDDLGAEKASAWTNEQIFTLLQHRYNNQLPTVITSNYDQALLFTHLSAGVDKSVVPQRIVSRIEEMCKSVQLQGVDRRLAQKQNQQLTLGESA